MTSKLQIGKINRLQIKTLNAVGAMLDGGSLGQILLTATTNTPELIPGNSIDAFIYLDAEGELAATTIKPHIQLDEIAWLKVADVTDVGGFLDWGLSKDLFIPFAEQQFDLIPGRHVLAKAYLDKRNRITASTRIDRFLKEHNEHFKVGDKVSLLIADKTELGYRAIINHEYLGLLFSSDLLTPVKKGQQHTGYIKQIRSDKKIDLSLTPVGFDQQRNDDIAQAILDALDEHQGTLLLGDKSPPEAIQKVFGVSKKAFKKACGSLYKKRLINIEEKRITRTQG